MRAIENNESRFLVSVFFNFFGSISETDDDEHRMHLILKEFWPRFKLRVQRRKGRGLTWRHGVHSGGGSRLSSCEHPWKRRKVTFHRIRILWSFIHLHVGMYSKQFLDICTDPQTPERGPGKWERISEFSSYVFYLDGIISIHHITVQKNHKAHPPHPLLNF